MIPPPDHEQLKKWIAEAQEANRIAIWRGFARMGVPASGTLLGFSYGPATHDGLWYAWLGLVLGAVVAVASVRFLWTHGVR